MSSSGVSPCHPSGLFLCFFPPPVAKGFLIHHHMYLRMWLSWLNNYSCSQTYRIKFIDLTTRASAGTGSSEVTVRLRDDGLDGALERSARAARSAHSAAGRRPRLGVRSSRPREPARGAVGAWVPGKVPILV